MQYLELHKEFSECFAKILGELQENLSLRQASKDASNFDNLRKSDDFKKKIDLLKEVKTKVLLINLPGIARGFLQGIGHNLFLLSEQAEKLLPSNPEARKQEFLLHIKRLSAEVYDLSKTLVRLHDQPRAEIEAEINLVKFKARWGIIALAALFDQARMEPPSDFTAFRNKIVHQFIRLESHAEGQDLVGFCEQALSPFLDISALREVESLPKKAEEEKESKNEGPVF